MNFFPNNFFTASDIPVVRLRMLRGAEFLIWSSCFHILAVDGFSCCTRLFLTTYSMDFPGQRQYCSCILNPEAGLCTPLCCRQSRHPLICLLFVSVWLLLFLFVYVSLLLVECSDETFSAVIIYLSSKELQELAQGSVVGMLSDYSRNSYMLMRLQYAMERRFAYKRWLVRPVW